MLAIHGVLQYDISNTTPRVENVGVVTRVFKVFPESNLVLLHKFIHRWVDDGNDEHHRKDSLLTQSIIDVDFVYINHHGNHVDHMCNVAHQMRLVPVRVPFELNKILDAFALEDVELVAFVETFEQVQSFIFHSLSFVVVDAVFSDYWQEVDGVTYFVELT